MGSNKDAGKKKVRAEMLRMPQGIERERMLDEIRQEVLGPASTTDDAAEPKILPLTLHAMQAKISREFLGRTAMTGADAEPDTLTWEQLERVWKSWNDSRQAILASEERVLQFAEELGIECEGPLLKEGDKKLSGVWACITVYGTDLYVNRWIRGDILLTMAPEFGLRKWLQEQVREGKMPHENWTPPPLGWKYLATDAKDGQGNSE